MAPLLLAMELAQFAPGLIKWITGSDKAADVAGKVVDVAQAITGTGTGEEALAALKADATKMLEFKQAMATLDADLERARLADVADARKRDTELAKAGLFNYRANMLAGGACALVVFCLAIMVWRSGLDNDAKAVITLILGRALGWIEQVFSFEFGTNRTSRAKDDTIDRLTK
jgi:hypothetical protein